MTDALFNVGNRLSAEDWLRLSSAVDGVRNERNSLLRGVSAIIPGVSVKQIADSGFSTNLRRYSTANDEEIANTIMSNASGIDFKDEKAFKNWYDRKNYPPTLWPKVVDQWYKTKGREESAATARYAADRAAQADLMDPLNLESKEQTIAKEKKRIEDADLTESMSIVALHAAQNDIKAIRNGADYYDTVQKRIANETDGWTKVNLDYYKALMDEADLEPKATATTKAVYDTRSGQQRWMTEDDIQALNKANPGTIVPTSEAPADEQQVAMGMLSAASQVLYDDAILTAAKVTADEAREILQIWASDKSWLARFNEIPENLRLLHKEWYKAYEGVMDRWYNTSTTGTVIGG